MLVDEIDKYTDNAEFYSEVETMPKKKPKTKDPRGVKAGTRAIQISMPLTIDQLSLSILSILAGSNSSQVIREVLEPYFKFVKKMLQEDKMLDEYGSIQIDPETIISFYNQQVGKNPKEYLNKMREYEKEHGISFDNFIHPENMYK